MLCVFERCVKTTTLLSGGVCHATDPNSTRPAVQHCLTPSSFKRGRDPRERAPFKAETAEKYYCNSQIPLYVPIALPFRSTDSHIHRTSPRNIYTAHTLSLQSKGRARAKKELPHGVKHTLCYIQVRGSLEDSRNTIQPLPLPLPLLPLLPHFLLRIADTASCTSAPLLPLGVHGPRSFRRRRRRDSRLEPLLL